MDEFLKSLSSWFRERTTSPFYGTFFMALIFWNWKIFYVLFCESPEIIGKPKIEYIKNMFFHFDPVENALWHDIVEAIINFADTFIVPLLISLFLITKFPKYTNKLHQINLNYLYERKKNARKKELDLQKIETKMLKEKEKQTSVKAKIEKTKTQKELWDKEFEKIKDSPKFDWFEELRQCVYDHRGFIRFNDNWSFLEKIPFFHSNGIVEYSDENRNHIALTEKGKYFMKKYLDEKAHNKSL